MFYDIYLHFWLPLKNRKLSKALKLSRQSSKLKKINCQSYHPIEILLSKISGFQIPEKELMESHPVVKDKACSTQLSYKTGGNLVYWNVPLCIFNSGTEPQFLQVFPRRPSLINVPLSNRRPLSDNYSKLVGINKKGQNHSVHSVSYLINKALRISSCSMSSSK